MRQQPTERSGPLTGHVRQGRRRFVPPLAATGVLVLGDWIRDDLPDLLWPVLLAALDGNSAIQAFVNWQRAVIADLNFAVAPKDLARGLDGRLTSLDALVAVHPEAREVAVTHARTLHMLPASVVAIFSTYPERPASWLGDTDTRATSQEDIDFLARALVEVIGDQHRESLVKCISIWSAVQAGTFNADQSMVDLIKSYPGDSDNRSRADAVVRASWGSTRAANVANESSYLHEALQWAGAFWNFNSTTTNCTRERAQETNDPEAGEIEPATESTDNDGATPGGSTPAEPIDREQLAKDLVSSYVEAIETSSPRDLYTPEREEVHTGLVLRAGREVITALGLPQLWTTENGSHIGRMLIEVRIYLSWMAIQEPPIYKQFQEYGAGKAKLHSLIAGEVPEKMQSPAVRDAINILKNLSRNDSIIDHRAVDTRDGFADGKSLRTMAEECNLLDLYRHAYQPASGITHSEWWSVEMHSMERCQNILHRGHLIPSLSLSNGGSEQLADAWLDLLYTLIVVSLETLEVEPAYIQSAFEWMEVEEENDSEVQPMSGTAGSD